MNECLLEAYLIYLMTRQRVASNTYLAYKRDVRQFLDFYQTYENVSDIREILIDFRDSLLQRGTGSRSLARKLSAMRSFFHYLHEFHPQTLATENPAALIGHLPKIERRLPRVCSISDIAQMIQTARTEKNGAQAELILLLLYTAGLRVSELVSLTFGAFHLPTQRLTIRGKGGKMRVIPLIKETCEVVERYKQTKGAVKPSELLFTLTRQTVWRIIKKITRKAGISSSVSPHVLRHAIATHSLEEGWDLRSLQLFLGHERIVTTEMYIHLDTRFVKSEYKKRHTRK